MEVPWGLGPPDGRYLLREPGARPDAPPFRVLVIATLGAFERRSFVLRRRPRRIQAEVEPDPKPVATWRATVIDVTEPFARRREAESWLAQAGEGDLEQDLAVLNRSLHAFRLAAADPYLSPVRRDHLLVGRVGYGVGEEVAEGLWTEAHELVLPARRQRRSRVLAPQARLAALLGGREPSLACEELALRARLDLEQERPREAALQVLIALDAAIAELAADPAAEALDTRLAELREQREPIAEAAQAALAGSLTEGQLASVEFAVSRIEAALRARAVAGA